MALEPGTHLGRYEIVSLVGSGGMGEVYRARDTRLDRDVAIKVLPTELSEDASYRQRLEREAKTISQLQHPNVCTLHDFDSADGADFLVMEYLEGDTLEDRIGRRTRTRASWAPSTDWHGCFKRKHDHLSVTTWTRASRQRKS